MGDHPNTMPHRYRAAPQGPVAARPAPPPRKRWSDSPHYAALDLGTNNCRLLIARPAGTGFSLIVRLGEGLAATGQLSEAAIDRTIAALRICADKLRRRNVTVARSVATETCHRAANGADFIERAYRETGIRLDIISAEEEARLAVLGCHALIEPGDGPALIFDIGGGSTELVLDAMSGDAPRVLDWQSAPWGVVSRTERAGGGGEVAARLAAYARMRSLAAESFAAFAERLPASPVRPRLLGTSGTVTTLASVYLGLDHYDRAQVDGLIVPATSMRRSSSDLSGMALAERARSVPMHGKR